MVYVVTEKTKGRRLAAAHVQYVNRCAQNPDYL